jgi:hypothetical protein
MLPCSLLCMIPCRLPGMDPGDKAKISTTISVTISATIWAAILLGRIWAAISVKISATTSHRTSPLRARCLIGMAPHTFLFWVLHQRALRHHDRPSRRHPGALPGEKVRIVLRRCISLGRLAVSPAVAIHRDLSCEGMINSRTHTCIHQEIKDQLKDRFSSPSEY